MWRFSGKRSSARQSQLLGKGRGGRLSSDAAVLWTQDSSHLFRLPAPGPALPAPTVLPQPLPGRPTAQSWVGHLGLREAGTPDATLPVGPLLSFPLLIALPTPLSGLIKELCSLFMYGPSLIGVFVFPHYSQLDRAV